jgi:hypothetical protein
MSTAKDYAELLRDAEDRPQLPLNPAHPGHRGSFLEAQKRVEADRNSSINMGIFY